LSSIASCNVTPENTIEWWNAFHKRDKSGDLYRGFISQDHTKLMVFGWDSENALTGPDVEGTADLRSNPSVTELVAPVVATGRTPDENLADTQTKEIRNAECYIQRGTARIPIAPVQVKAKNEEAGTVLHYNGLYFCVPVTELRNGDTIEFGGDGSGGYHTWGHWAIIK
jgi:hypothetical protein